MSMLEVENLTVRYGALTIVDGASFTLDAGEWLMLVGPNGAGKSTLLGAVSGGVPMTGAARLMGKDVRAYRPGRLAREMGMLAQGHAVGYSFTVEEIVALGRYAYARGPFAPRTDEDAAMIRRALDLTGLAAQRGQAVTTLSGGELQRAFLAQVFAQDPKLLLLDEPTNHLDLKYQRQVFTLIGEWLQTPGRAVLSVVHDLSLARAYGTRALLMDAGRIIADGSPDAVLNADNLQAVYGMDVHAWMRALLSRWSA